MGEIMNKIKKKDKSLKILYLFIVIIIFTLAFLLLINKQKEEMLADSIESNFNVKPEIGKVIVARDMYAIYPKYYVVFIDNNRYALYVYNYYDTVSQYNLEFNRLIDKIVDYSMKDKMIRYLDSRGYGTYNEVLNNLSIITECTKLKIY